MLKCVGRSSRRQGLLITLVAIFLVFASMQFIILHRLPDRFAYLSGLQCPEIGSVSTPTWRSRIAKFVRMRCQHVSTTNSALARRGEETGITHLEGGASACPAACVDSWSEGDWVEWCPRPECGGKRQCGFNFVPRGKQCLFHFFGRAETAECMQDQWLLVLGSSLAMNFGLAWLQQLDPEGSASPFYGPRWYNLSCHAAATCNPSLGSARGFVSFRKMRLDMVMDAKGAVRYKRGDSPLAAAPPTPAGGWRLSVVPVQFAREAVAAVEAAAAEGRGVPAVYVSLGQWYLNAFDGKAQRWLERAARWGMNASHAALLHRLPAPPDLLRAFARDMEDMARALRRLGVPRLLVGGLPLHPFACSKRDAMGCRALLNGVLSDLVRSANAHANASTAPEHAWAVGVEWATLSQGEQGAAHSSPRASLLAAQRLLSVLCPRRLRNRPPQPDQQAMDGECGGRCGSMGQWSAGCRAESDWQLMVGRSCRLQPLPLPAQSAWAAVQEAGRKGAGLGRLRVSGTGLQEEGRWEHGAGSSEWQMLLLAASLLAVAALLLAPAPSSHSSPASPVHSALPLPQQSEAAGDGKGAAEAGTRKRRLDGIGGARLVASLSVAATHYSRMAPPAVPPAYGLSWGYTWVPWFFMLSAFVLTYAALNKRSQRPSPGQASPEHTADDIETIGVVSKGEGIAQQAQLLEEDAFEEAAAFLQKRLLSVYPLYLFGVFLSLLQTMYRGSLASVQLFPLLSQLFLMQAWFPAVTEHAVQPHCWFLSAIVPFWMLHPILLRRIAPLSSSNLLTLLVLFSLLPWIVLVVVPTLLGVRLSWYSDHKWGSTNSFADILVITLKFHPMCYLHLYTFGVCLACLYQRHQQGPSPWIFRYGAVLAYSGLWLIFTTPSLRPPAHKLLCRMGGLAPLHGLLLLGLAEGRDPVARALGCRILRELGKCSFALYILQFLALSGWGQSLEAAGAVSLWFWLFLLVLSFLAQKCVQEPLADSDKFGRRIKASAIVVALGVGLISTLPAPVRRLLFRSQRISPAVVLYSNSAVDFRLPFQNPDNLHEYKVLNPSFALDVESPSILWIAAQLHNEMWEYSCDAELCPPRGVNFWRRESGLLLASLPVSELRPGGPPVVFSPIYPPLPHPQTSKHSSLTTGGWGGWIPCTPPPAKGGGHLPETVEWSTGPERASVHFQDGGKALGLTFFSYFPLPATRDKVDGDSPPTPCKKGQIGGMFESIARANSMDAATSHGGHEEELGPDRQPTLRTTALRFEGPGGPKEVERGWMGFPGEAGRYYIRSLHPFVVVRHGVAGGGEMHVVFKEEVESLRRAVQREGKRLQGGSDLCLVERRCEGRWQKHADTDSDKSEDLDRHNDNWRGPSGGYLLGVFHSRGGGKVENFLLAVQRHTPYSVLGISPALPLIVPPLMRQAEAVKMKKSSNRGEAVATGLFVTANCSEAQNAESEPSVVVGYRSGEMDSRALRLPISVVERWLFQSSSAP